VLGVIFFKITIGPIKQLDAKEVIIFAEQKLDIFEDNKHYFSESIIFQ
jgi:hypothetical protein